MMYQPKTGEHVIWADRRWKVQCVYDHSVDLVVPDRDTIYAHVPTQELHTDPQQPLLPPEPSPGEVVFAHGQYWQHGEGRWGTVKSNGDWAVPGALWAEIADDAEPVVPVSRVVEWLKGERYTESASLIEAEFGWEKNHHE
jgi:hypothetical protein